MEVDLVIKSKWIVPVVPREQIFTDHAIAIKSKKILAIGPTESIIAQYQCTNITSLNNHILIPGLVNAHGGSKGVK